MTTSAATTTDSAPKLPAARMAYVDGLRGLGVAGVVIYHACIWGGLNRDHLPWHLARMGRPGVDLFLLLSGFCLFWPLVKASGGEAVRPIELREYARRRTRRIVPPYLAALTLFTILALAVYQWGGTSWWGSPFQGVFPWKGADSWANLASHLTLTHGFVSAYSHSFDGAFWSLSLEWQFYWLLPPLIALAVRLGKAGRPRLGILLAVATPFVVTLTWRGLLAWKRPSLLAPDAFAWTDSAPGRWIQFGAGMLAAVVVARCLAQSSETPSNLQRTTWRIAALLALSMAFAAEWVFPESKWLPLAWSIGATGLFLYPALTMGRARRLLEWPPLVRLGHISYSLYLIHGSVYMALAIFLSRLPGDVIGSNKRTLFYLLVGIPLALLSALAFFKRFEEPFLKR